jgi:hypothetical protein
MVARKSALAVIEYFARQIVRVPLPLDGQNMKEFLFLATWHADLTRYCIANLLHSASRHEQQCRQMPSDLCCLWQAS